MMNDQFIKGTWDGWNQYWFASRAARCMLPLRVAICGITAFWFASFVGGVDAWFGDSGILTPSLAARVIAFGELPAWQYWSPLWFADSATACKLWLFAGIVLCMAGVSGWGGRITLGILLAWVIAWAHRILWLAGPTEPALVAMLAYLVLEPGPTLRKAFYSDEENRAKVSWTAGCALRLVQTHWWILVAAGLLTQLSDVVWWRGEAVWWLASAGQSRLLSASLLADSPTMVNGLTHGVIAVQMLALWLLTVHSGRWLGIVFGALSCLAIGLVADQLIYATLLASCLLAFRPSLRYVG